MDFKIIDLLQGSDAWKAWRRTKITSTDAGPIMGESPYKTAVQLYTEKENGEETICTPAMQRGKNLEPEAREWFNLRMGPPYFATAVIESTKYTDLGASLDGLRYVDGQIEILEIKCNGEKNHLEVLAGSVPALHRAQLQHAMLVSGAKFLWYLSFDGNEGVILTVPADLEYQKAMLAKEQVFLALRKANTPPEPTDKDEVEIDDPEAVGMAKKYIDIFKEIQELEIEATMLKEMLIEHSVADRTVIGPILLRCERREGTIDYKAIPEIAGMNLDKYRKPKVVCWKIIERKEDANGSPHLRV